VTETQEQLISSIEQQLENLMSLDVNCEYMYEFELYSDDEQPIVERFTPELLKELEDLVYQLDN
jgi:hypothetical protein